MKHLASIAIAILSIIGLTAPITVRATSPTWSLTAVGDIMLDRNVWSAINKYGKNYPFAKIATQLKGADMVLGNLEGPFTNSKKHAVSGGSLIFNFDPVMAPYLKQAGFTLLSLANNHTLNQGQAGLNATRQTLKKLGLATFGDPRNAVGYTQTQTVNGKKITFIGYHGLADGFATVLAQVKRSRATSDVIIVVPHWGAEYKLNIQRSLQIQAHQLINAGADTILGGHPHVVEPLEIYKGKLIAYSLGNFVFDQYFSADTQRGLMLKLAMTNVNLTVNIIPLVSIRTQIQVATGSTRTTLLNRLAAGTPNSAGIRNQIKRGVLTIPFAYQRP